MKVTMKPALVSIFLVAAVGAGCASSHHSDHQRHDPRPEVVIVPPPPPRVVVRSISERNAIQIARHEAARRGWRRAEVERAGFWDGVWHVGLVYQPRRERERQGWVEIAPDGAVLDFSEAPRHRAYWDGRPSREYRRR